MKQDPIFCSITSNTDKRTNANKFYNMLSAPTSYEMPNIVTEVYESDTDSDFTDKQFEKM